MHTKLIGITTLFALLAVGGLSLALAGEHKHDHDKKDHAKHEHKSKEAMKAKVGHKAPDFKLHDHNGKEVKLSQFFTGDEKKVVVLEWFNNECPFVKHLYQKNKTMNELAAKYKGRDVVWLTINSTKHHDREHNAKLAKEWNIDRPILNDKSGEVGRIYGAKRTPEMFVINRDGKIVYRGAIDNSPLGNTKGDDKVNYVHQVLEQVTADETVTIKKTKPYGCSVKYAPKPKKDKQA